MKTKCASFYSVVVLSLAAVLLLAASFTTQGSGDGFSPVPLPDPRIPGYRFPEKESTILNWVTADNQTAINKHAWGLWTALTAKSGEVFEGQNLRVFETWFTPSDILSSLLDPDRQKLFLQEEKRDPRPLAIPNQLVSTPVGPQVLKAAPREGEETVTGFVKYDPEAANFIVKEGLFSKAKLNRRLAAGQTAIPDFPDNAVSLKPVFQTLSSRKLVDGRYYRLKAWTGPPSPPRPYGPSAWPSCVWVDIKDLSPGPGSGQVDSRCNPGGSSRTRATTYGVGQFIHFRLSSQQAEQLNALQAAQLKEVAALAEGDYAILLAMHVTSREITRWTWQTFWWSHSPGAPAFPSSRKIAAERPRQLQGPPRNYAHCSSYSMVIPAQPNTGGANKGESLYCYNPWLEAGFSPSVLPASKPGTYQGRRVANNVGVQTNCMSCHAMASYSRKGINLAGFLYTGDRYVDLNGPQFRGNLKVDFLWSIPANAR